MYFTAAALLWSVCALLTFPAEDRCHEGVRLASCQKAPQADVTIDRVVVAGQLVYREGKEDRTPKNLEELRAWIGPEKTEELLSALNMDVLMEFGQKVLNSHVPFNYPYRVVLTDKSELIVYGLLTDVDPEMRAKAPSPESLPPQLPLPKQKRRSRAMRLLRGDRASVSGLAVKWTLPSTSCAENASAAWSEESAWTACKTITCVGASFQMPDAIKCGGAAGTVRTPNVDRLNPPADFLAEQVVGFPDLCTRNPASCDVVSGSTASVTALFTAAELGPFAGQMARNDGLAVVWSLHKPFKIKTGNGSSWAYRAFWTECDDMECLMLKLQGKKFGRVARVMRFSRRASNLLKRGSRSKDVQPTVPSERFSAPELSALP